ncbi:hypothetical protein SPRG_00477 [Saprolegnia parasitica CBS 223.65]|uniref:Aminoglycoside phosphotransferase domain-containing protein n=1 Tax=Saprolegnia parasitica (strain CBS 223.65) TaxID=695850 RepID=A0A067CYR9_SAPPC|nr:hypothetical protein SPRG_00477 [Saprolegnia parasitica CBS 223.65]KDO35633.1 hypothetical protein SPRG_00477 [Saprolegnia parasitica CBS 223.65]|eukprot:XP_012193961.1 hypothetical protein SPRG_00477 [Saprolegnia parasitica CBS 223.65]
MASADSPHFVDIAMDTTLATALIRVKLPAFPEVAAIADVKVGFNNRCYVVTTLDHRSYILRLTKDSWPATKIVAEAASLAAVRYLKLDIPVPKLVAFNEISDPTWHVRWMLMEKLPGRLLDDVWESVDEATRADLARQIQTILKTLQKPRFSQIGGWVFDDDGTTPVVGPYFDGNWGPFDSEADWLRTLFENQVRQTLTAEVLAPLRSLVAPARAALVLYLETTMSPSPIVLFHGDFAFRNMLVDDQNVVSGILDWEWCGVMPRWREYVDVSFEDRNVLSYVPSLQYENSEEYTQRWHVHQLIQGFAPWQIGAWPEKDAQYVAEAIVTIEAAIAHLKACTTN